MYHFFVPDNHAFFPSAYDQVCPTLPSQTTLLFFPQHMIKCVPHFHRRQPCFFSLSIWSSVSHTSIADNLAFFPSAYDQLCATLPSQTTLLFFPQHMINCVPHFHRRQPCFFSLPHHQVCAILPTQMTLLSFPNRLSSVCDASNTNDLAFFSQQIIKCVRCFQHKWPCFLFPTDYQVCAMLPTQMTLLSFPNRLSSVCDTSNTDDELVFPWLHSRRFPRASTKKVTLELWFKMDFILLHCLLPFGVAAAIILIWPVLEKRMIPAKSSLCSGDHLFG